MYRLMKLENDQNLLRYDLVVNRRKGFVKLDGTSLKLVAGLTNNNLLVQDIEGNHIVLHISEVRII